AGVLVGGNYHAKPRAGLQIDVRIDAALADEPQLGQTLQQGRADRGALPDQDQNLRVAQPLRKRIHVLHVVVPDRDVMACELAEAAERAHRVVIVVQYADFHAPRRSSWIMAAPFSAIIMVGALVLPEVM